MTYNIDSTEAALADLRPHPENERIYGNNDSIDDLLERIKQKGIREPIVITKDGEIIGGNRRCRAAKELGLTTVPIRVFASDDQTEIKEAILDYNQYRLKTNDQLSAEAALYMEIESQRAAQRMVSANAKDAVEKLPPDEKGKARDKVGTKLGMSGKTAEKAAKVAKAKEALKAAGKADEAAELGAALNKGFDTAYKLGVEKGHIPVTKHRAGRQKAAAAEELQNVEGHGAPVTTTSTLPEESESDKALHLIDCVLTFLRGAAAKAMTSQQKRDWGKVLDQISTARKSLGI